MTNKFMKNKKGFTLFELIVIIAIIAILALLAISKLTRYVKAAEVTNVINDTKVAEDKILEYMIKNNDAIPTNGTLVPINDIKTAINERKLYNSKGLVNAIDASKTYETINTSYIKDEIKSSLDGNFISSTDGEDVYYLSNEKIENIDDVTTFVRLFGGSRSSYMANINDLKQTSDGGYIVVGQTEANDGDFEGAQEGVIYDAAFIGKFNFKGDIEWIKTFAGETSNFFSSVVQISDGGYVVAGQGSINRDMAGISEFDLEAIIVKYSPVGEVEWIKAFGGFDDDYFTDIKQLSDGSFIAIGDTMSPDGDLETLDTASSHYDGLLIKYDSNGNLLWAKTLAEYDKAICFNKLQITLNGFIVVGSVLSGSDFDGMIINYDFNGNILWSDTFGGSEDDYFEDICFASNSGYIVSGRAYSNDGDLTSFHNGGVDTSDIILIQYEENGDVSWVKNFGGSKNEGKESMSQTKDGSYILALDSYSLDGDLLGYHDGTTNNREIVIVKFDKNMNIEWMNNIGSIDGKNIYFEDVEEALNGGYIIAGSTYSTNFTFDYNGDGTSMLIKFDALGNFN